MTEKELYEALQYAKMTLEKCKEWEERLNQREKKLEDREATRRASYLEVKELTKYGRRNK